MKVVITDLVISDDANYNRVEFSCDNGDSVGFVDSVSLAFACFLTENNELQPGAFKDMIDYVVENELEAIEIGTIFDE